MEPDRMISSAQFDALIKMMKEENEKILRDHGFVSKEGVELIQKAKDDVIKAKDEVVKTKDEAMKLKDELLEHARKEMLRLETELAVERSKYEAILTMRPLLEHGLVAWGGDTNTTNGLKRFLTQKVYKNGNLSPDTLAWINALEGPGTDTSAVKRNLDDLFHELSKLHHHPKLQHVKGLVCGGNFPLRTATAVVLLALQKESAIRVDIQYMDESYVLKGHLKGGVVS
jgi:hypothetical protein